MRKKIKRNLSKTPRTKYLLQIRPEFHARLKNVARLHDTTMLDIIMSVLTPEVDRLEKMAPSHKTPQNPLRKPFP